MNYELILALQLTCGTTRQKDREDYFAMLLNSQGATNGTTVCSVHDDGGAEAIARSIDATVSDPDSYEPEEPHPSQQAIEATKTILTLAEENGLHIPNATVSTYYGELNLTWQRGDRFLRLISYSDNRQPTLYFYTQSGDPLPQGEVIQPVGPQQFAERIAWLVG